MKAPVGRVYVLSNPAMPGLLKIGYTLNTVEGRVKELSLATGVPIEFCIEYQLECRDPAGLEAYAHNFFQNRRYNGNREFFSISINDAIEVLRQNANELLAEEFSDRAKESSSIKIPATLYLVRVNKSQNIFRLGLFQQEQNFLQSEEFKLLVVELYNKFNPNFFYECEVLQTEEFFCASNLAFQEMRRLADGNIARLKSLNKELIHQTATYPYRTFDLRTLAFKEYKESIPIQIFNSSLSLIKPISKASDEKTLTLITACSLPEKNLEL